MATKLLVLALACASAVAFPFEPQPITRNTIFGDEQIEGQIFDDLESQELLAIETRNVSTVNPYRLPTTTRPQHYNVLWAINISDLSMTGSVNISLYATQANINEIVIQSNELTISALSLVQGNTVIPVTYTLEPEYHFLRVRLTSGNLAFSTPSTLYNLIIDFGAPLREDMYGIYRSWFRNSPSDTTVRWMASTQFQSTSSRSAFPCYDEPGFKATFNITIRRPTTHRSWSCMRIRETTNSLFTGYQEDVYYQTPIMSTYLLALVVAEYDSLELIENNLLTYEVIARPGALSDGQGQYAFDAGRALLAEMNDHTAINFYTMNPNLKMTQASIPDFSAGAMENWGLLTYREAYLMYSEQHTNSYFKQLIGYILSHEIAHMWFGNLVTCDFWDVLWLNEGFARYYQYFLTYWVEDFGLNDRFITEQVHTSLLSDSANNPQPLTNPGIGSPASVSAMFSTISYNKGAAVIRMTEHLMGFNNHRQGLRNYLVESPYMTYYWVGPPLNSWQGVTYCATLARRVDTESFTTASPIHLFQALQNAGNVTGAFTEYDSDFSLIEYYQSWTEQGGHPVLNVQVNHTTGEMTIYQRRFNINTGYGSVNTNYIVPITFATASNSDFNNTKPSHIISKSVTTINRGSVGDEWVIFNKQQTGFYRVNYDDYTWDLITIALRGNQRNLIHEYNRAQIVNDVFQFARSGLMSYERAFNILSFLENETEYTPWVAAITGFTWLRNRLIGTPQLTQLDNLIIRLSSTAINSLTYYPIPGESFMRSYLRYQLAPFLCTLGVGACRTAATAQYNALVNQNQEVPVDSRNWVYCNALREGNEAVFNTLWNRFQNHNVYTEKIQLLMVLGCTPHTASLNTYLGAIVTSNFVVRPQDYTTAFNSAATGNEGNTQIVFTYIQNNLALVTNAFGNAATPLSYVSSRLRTEAEIQAFQTWATNNQAALGTSYQAVYNGAESTRQSLQYASQIESDLTSYFTNGDTNYQVTTAAPTTTTTVVTTAQPSLVEPSTPNLPVPDSAATSAVSIVSLTIAFMANRLL